MLNNFRQRHLLSWVLQGMGAADLACRRDAERAERVRQPQVPERNHVRIRYVPAHHGVRRRAVSFQERAPLIIHRLWSHVRVCVMRRNSHGACVWSPLAGMLAVNVVCIKRN